MILCGGNPHDTLCELAAASVNCFVSLQSKGEAHSYRDGAKKHCGPSCAFLEQPITDQDVTADEQIAALVLRVLSRVHDGRVAYVHCRGGHGRTGTVCALILGLLYDLDGPRALVTYQALHDLRQQPCFASSGYEPNADGDSCVALFPAQRAQVLRLLRPSAARAAEAAAMAAMAAVSVSRGKSDIYGRGASQYEETTLQEWKREGEAAGEAARQKDWGAARAGYERCVELRPDWEKARQFLEVARKKEQRQLVAAEAAEAAVTAVAPVPPPPAPVPLAADATEAVVAEPLATTASSATSAASTGRRDAGSVSNAPSTLASSKRGLPSFVVLVGLPGAGKSTLCAALTKGGGWEVVSQDELGGKGAVEEAVVNAVKAGKRLVLDRCNVRRADRARILDIAMHPKDAVVVHLTTAAEACVARVASRTDHPTIPYGHGRSAVASMAKALEPPGLSEGFAAIHTLGSPEEVAALLRHWGAADVEPEAAGLYKFPRTHHVLNTGGTAVTRDDLVMSDADARRFFDGEAIVVAEEKVDGANLGFSLTKEYTILAQNRSHFVSAESATQFKSLDRWLEEHGWALCQLLEPEVEVLFGEWCYLQHSVAYTKLPGHFVAFDIFNKRTKSFCSVAERNRRLGGLGIPVVRQLARQAFTCKEQILALLERQSAYADGFVEGTYLRIDTAEEAGTTNTLRGKVVRPDFIQGCSDGHWLGKEPVKNVVRPDLWTDEAAEGDEY